jgi:hypothetical protein
MARRLALAALFATALVAGAAAARPGVVVPLYRRGLLVRTGLPQLPPGPVVSSPRPYTVGVFDGNYIPVPQVGRHRSQRHTGAMAGRACALSVNAGARYAGRRRSLPGRTGNERWRGAQLRARACSAAPAPPRVRALPRPRRAL